MEAAKARKARMTERGAEVDKLMSLAGTPLLVDMSTSRAGTSGGPGKSSAGGASRSHNEPVDRGSAGEGAGKNGPPVANDTVKQAAKAAGAPTAAPGAADKHQGSSSSSKNRNDHQPGPVETSGGKKDVRGSSTAEAAQPNRGYRDSSKALLSRSRSTPAAVALDQAVSKGVAPAGTSVAAESAGKMSVPPSSLLSPPGLDASRIAATASTPQLPCFSLESSPQHAFLERRTGELRGATLQPCAQQLAHLNAASTRKKVTSASTSVAGCYGGGGSGGSGGSGRARHWTGQNVADKLQHQARNGMFASRNRSIQGNHEGVGGVGGGIGEPEVAEKAALTAARGEASTLLASHLMPFPTITKNRSLHAVSQPVVRHSDGFADACRAESSRLGTTAWRVARDARYQGLVAQEDRLSILRQIEAGFDALQGRGARVSPVA